MDQKQPSYNSNNWGVSQLRILAIVLLIKKIKGATFDKSNAKSVTPFKNEDN